MEFVPYYWLGVIVAAVVIEALTVGLVSLWFVPGALVAMILAFFNVPIAVQIIVFLVLAGTGIVLARTVFRKQFFREKTESTNVDAIIGKRGIVSERIDNLSGCGQVKVGGQVWSARSLDPDILFEPGEVVTVVAVEGVKLICR